MDVLHVDNNGDLPTGITNKNSKSYQPLDGWKTRWKD